MESSQEGFPRLQRSSPRDGYGYQQKRIRDRKNSCDEINDFLDYLKELEEHYIKEYGE